MMDWFTVLLVFILAGCSMLPVKDEAQWLDVAQTGEPFDNEGKPSAKKPPVLLVR